MGLHLDGSVGSLLCFRRNEIVTAFMFAGLELKSTRSVHRSHQVFVLVRIEWMSS